MMGLAGAAVQIGEQNRPRAEFTFGNVIVKLDKLEIHGEKLAFERRVFKPSTPPCFSLTQ
jgi:hypothetical protein